MWSCRHLMDDFLSDGNIKLAIMNASKGKRSRASVRPLVQDPDTWIPVIREYALHFRNSKHVPKTINDNGHGKQRTIIVPVFMEQVVHHMLVNKLKPIIMRGMYEHSYGSVPGRGIHLAKKRIERWLHNDRRGTKYFLKMDIRKFFASMPNEMLKKRIARNVKDPDFLRILYEVIDVQQGLPLGFYTSQWLANWYLQDLDHFIKEKLHAHHYVRYMDDMVIFGSNKRELHRFRREIEVFLNKMGLRLKDSWCVARFVHGKSGKEFGRDLDFMGFRFYRNRTVLRRSIMIRATRLARHMKKTVSNARRFMSYLGWFTHTDTYNVFRKWIRPYLDIRRLKIKIARSDARRITRCYGIRQATAHP